MKRLTLVCVIFAILLPAIGASAQTASWKKDTSPVTLSAFMAYTWWPMDVWGEDLVSKEITRITGVSLDMTKATDDNQLKVMLATGNLPDLVYTDNQALYSLLEKPDVSYAYDDLIKQYAPELLKTLDPLQIFLNLAPDGHFYRIKSHYSSEKDWSDPRDLPSPGDTSLHVRTDILAAIGNPPINSVEDFLSVMKTVKAKYPSMIGYLPEVDYRGSILLEDVGLPGSATAQYRMANGRVTLAYLAPAMADYLKLANQFFRNNYTPAEALTYKYEQFLQVVRSGNVFSAVYHAPFSDEQNRFFEENKIPGTWKPITKPLTVGGQVRFHPVNSSFMGWSGLFITKHAKRPDRAIRFYEYLKSDEGDQLAQWGLPGKQWTLTSDGYLQRPADFLTMDVAKAGVGPNYGLWCFGASGLREGIINASVALSDPKHATSLDALRARKSFYVRDPILASSLPVIGTDMYTILGKLVDLYTNSETDLLLAPTDEALNAKYQALLSNAANIGSRSLEDYMTAAYNKSKASYDTFMKGQ